MSEEIHEQRCKGKGSAYKNAPLCFSLKTEINLKAMWVSVYLPIYLNDSPK